jgi:hypothetical protein
VFLWGCSNPFAGGIRTDQRGGLIMEHVIGGKYKLGRKIGSGSFGELYLGTFYVFYAQNGCDLLTRNPFLFFLVWLSWFRC